jgi:hypothetical protein
MNFKYFTSRRATLKNMLLLCRMFKRHLDMSRILIDTQGGEFARKNVTNDDLIAFCGTVSNTKEAKTNPDPCVVL